MNISKDELIKLYVEQNLTTYQIAEIYNVHRKTISRKLKKYGINIVNGQRKFLNAKKQPIQNIQRELIIGSLLGDGCISLHGRKNKSYRFALTHSEKQKEYLMHKRKILGNLVQTTRTHQDKKSKKNLVSFTTLTHNGFKPLEKLFYVNRLKIIPKNIDSLLTPFVMAIWFQDDGSLNKNVNMRISTDCFTFEEQKLLQNAIKINFNINVKILEYTRREKKYYYLSLNKRNSILLTQLIQPFVVNCMKYKLVKSLPND